MSPRCPPPCSQASLLLDDQDKWVHIGWGLIVHVSFAQGTTDEAVCVAARKVMHAPVLTRGVWGDGARPQSVAQFCQDQQVLAQQPAQHRSPPPSVGGAGPARSGRSPSGGVADGDGGGEPAVAAREEAACPDVLVIPQAALTNNYTGKSIQYRNQCGREESKRLFELFVAQLRNPLTVHPDDPLLKAARGEQNMGVFLERQVPFFLTTCVFFLPCFVLL
jgi:hypothetical protein